MAGCYPDTIDGEVIEYVGTLWSWADSNYQPECDNWTKVGGLPDGPFPQVLSSKPHLLRCATCQKDLCLVAQVHAPISEKSWELVQRTIFVFGCLTPTCGRNPRSWRAIRVQKSKSTNEEEEEEVVRETAIASSPVVGWNSDKCTEDGNDEDIDLEELGRALSEAASVASISKQINERDVEPIVESSPLSGGTGVVSNNTPVLPCFYTCVEEDIDSWMEKWKESILETISDEEAYEYTGTRNPDRTYLWFRKRLDRHPLQCFRYAYGGKPLLAMEEVEDPGRCRHCGGAMQYEMQLTPALLYFLQKQSDDSLKETLENWTWMTVIIFTCSESCFLPSDEEKSDIEGWDVAEEAIVVQYEKTVGEQWVNHVMELDAYFPAVYFP